MNTSEIFLNIDNLPGILNKSQLYELLEKAKAIMIKLQSKQ